MVGWCHGGAAAAVAGTCCLLMGLSQVSAQSVFLSEIHYDNSGADEGMQMSYAISLLIVVPRIKCLVHTHGGHVAHDGT